MAALGGCGYFYGYSPAVTPASYHYYDPAFAEHNQAALRSSRLQTAGFYVREYAGSVAATAQALAPGIEGHPSAAGSRGEYFKLNPDGSFHLFDEPASSDPDLIYARFSQLRPLGYYKIRGDTAWLEAQAPRRGRMYGRVVGYAHSLQLYWPNPDPEQVRPSRLRYHP